VNNFLAYCAGILTVVVALQFSAAVERIIKKLIGKK